MRLAAFISLAVSLLAAGALVSSTPTKTRRWNKGFVTIENGQFIRNGKQFRFGGTNAYYLASLNTETDINKTITSIAATGLKVIRTWAFNDVSSIPKNGTWFQLIADGTTKINTGPNGLQKLDAVVKLAEKAGVLLIMSLTNNWNPRPLVDNTTEVPVTVNYHGRRDVTLGTNNSLARNTLSNDYGGMDAYVREFGVCKAHDEFYTNETIVNTFLDYTTQIVSRYKDSPAILAWEVANDPRCNSSIASTQTCTTTTVTKWHATVSEHIAAIDPNHLISSGTQGFQCVDCPKLFPIAPPPSVSPTPQRRKRAVKPLTKRGLLAEVKERKKMVREFMKREMLERGDGLRIRGRWVAAREAGSSSDPGLPATFDGSFGVDSQDILNIPTIGFQGFQLFPDQNNYAISPPNPALPALNNTVLEGIKWIELQAQAAHQVRKPAVLAAFGLVTKENAPFFVPFNSTIAPFSNTTHSKPLKSNSRRQTASSGYGVSQTQQNDAYQQFILAASGNLDGAMQYQWGQTGLSSNDGSTVNQNNDVTGTSGNSQTGSSPNDGYSSAPTSGGTLASLAAAF